MNAKISILIFFKVHLFGILILLFANHSLADTEYTNNTSISCNKTVINVLSDFFNKEDEYPICKKQEIIFNTSKEKLKILYKPSTKNPYLQPMISNISCIKMNRNFYILVQNTNYANCKMGCEWIDLYSDTGKYIGSTKGISRAMTKNFKPLSRKYMTVVKNSLVVSESFIPRANKE